MRDGPTWTALDHPFYHLACSMEVRYGNPLQIPVLVQVNPPFFAIVCFKPAGFWIVWFSAFLLDRLLERLRDCLGPRD